MPCDGPNKEYSYERGAKVYEEVMTFLKEKYRIEDPGREIYFPILREHWIIGAENLKKAIQEMVWNQDCVNW